MITNLTKQDLIDFERDIANRFKNKEIRAPIHLASGNENQLITIFDRMKKHDWVVCTWRSHLAFLLKGVPREEMLKAIIAGKSISLQFPAQRCIANAIVGHNLSVGLGLALAAKYQEKNETVYIFVGDMTSLTGDFAECHRYAVNHDLPVRFVVEDNGVSVCTPTAKVWNERNLINALAPKTIWYDWWETEDSAYEPQDWVRWYPELKLVYYEYSSIYPHSGPDGERIQF